MTELTSHKGPRVADPDTANLDMRIDQEPPEPKRPALQQHDDEQIDGYRILQPLARPFAQAWGCVAAPMWSLIITSFMMALLASVLPAWLAPFGMAAMFLLSVLISTIYWIRYYRDEQLHDAVEDLEDRIIELEQAIIERMDLIVRNVI